MRDMKDSRKIKPVFLCLLLR